MEDDQADAWVGAAMEQYEDRLLRYACHFVHDLELARDIVQDTFLKLCREPDPEVRSRLGPWLFTVCRNRAIDVCRKENRMKVAPEYELEAGRVASSESSNPAVAVEKTMAAQQVMQCVSGLPDRQQEIIRLKFHGGLTYREIAEVMELSVSNVGVILHSAIGKLRKQMGGEV